jgi:cutinase
LRYPKNSLKEDAEILSSPGLVVLLKLAIWCAPLLIKLHTESSSNAIQGAVVGPPTSDGLKRNFGSDAVATEGIDYAAAEAPNVYPGGTDLLSKLIMKTTLQIMANKCPDSVIVTGGYSQGAAVNHRAIEDLEQSVQDQIAGVVLYGDTQKQQVILNLS